MRARKLLENDGEVIHKLCDVLGSDAKKALETYTKFVTEGKLVSRRREVVLAASIYISARLNNEPVTIHEVTLYTNENKASLEQTVRTLGGQLPQPNTDIFVTKGLKRLNQPPNIMSGMSIEKVRNDLGTPMRAAIALFVAAHMVDPSITISNVSDAVGVSTATLRHYVVNDGTLKEAAL
jgi:transcription initiation factor TFIIIB Brf1 subunit/transcription initiation factor TFIIB